MKICHLPLGTAFLCALQISCRADVAGDALLQRCIDAEGRTQAFEARFTHQFTESDQLRVQSGMIRLKKPNLAHIVVESPKQEKTGNIIINSNGADFITYSVSDNDYNREAADIAGGNVARNNILETSIFFSPDQLNRIRAMARGVRIRGEISVGNTSCRILEFEGIPELKLRLYVGPDDLLRGIDKVFRGVHDETHLMDLRRTAPLTSADFRWRPPRGAKTAEQVQSSLAAEAGGQQAASLLSTGKTAPEFTLPAYSGGNVSLHDALKGHRAIVLNFWSYF